MILFLQDAPPEFEAAFQDIVELLRRHQEKMTAEQMLAVAANLLGKLIALQDQRTMTLERAEQIIQRNINLGNQQMVENLLNAKGGNA